jgi:hypothetical protein
LQYYYVNKTEFIIVAPVAAFRAPKPARARKPRARPAKKAKFSINDENSSLCVVDDVAVIAANIDDVAVIAASKQRKRKVKKNETSDSSDSLEDDLDLNDDQSFNSDSDVSVKKDVYGTESDQSDDDIVAYGPPDASGWIEEVRDYNIPIYKDTSTKIDSIFYNVKWQRSSSVLPVSNNDWKYCKVVAVVFKLEDLGKNTKTLYHKFYDAGSPIHPSPVPDKTVSEFWRYERCDTTMKKECGIWNNGIGKVNVEDWKRIVRVFQKSLK